MKLYKQFKPEQIQRWRCVPVSSVVKAANAAQRGSDYAGCSKSDIYSDIDHGRYNGRGTPDLELFVKIMDKFVTVHRAEDERLTKLVGEALRDVLGQPKKHDVIYDNAHGHPGIDTCRNCDSNSMRPDWQKPCTGKKQ